MKSFYEGECMADKKEYLRVLSDDGEIIFKTDNLELFDFSLEKFREFNFEIIEYTIISKIKGGDAPVKHRLHTSAGIYQRSTNSSSRCRSYNY